MPHNVFYQVIKEITSKKAGSQASLRTHPNGNPYYLFDLPVKDKTVIGSYTLTSHHLSVNEVPQGKYDEASQYHYTAYFIDENKHEYRLHMFYDAQDGCVSEPLLTVIAKDKTFKDVECQECHEGFNQLARDSISGLVASIRKDQNDKVKDLLAKYDELERKATELSVNLVQNKQAYLLIIDKQMALIQEILLYANKRLSIERNTSYLKRVKKAVESYNPAVQETAKAADNKQVNDQAATVTPEPKMNTVSPAEATAAVTLVKSDSKAKKKKENLSDKITALHAQLLDDEPLNLLANLIFIEFEVDAGAYNTKPDDILKLQKLRRKIEQIGRNLLLKALNSGNYEEADNLSAFYHLLPDDIIAFALTNNNFKLLEHLIKNEFLPINYGHFVINNESYDSLIAYFFKKVASISDKPQTAVAPVPQSAAQNRNKIADMVECVRVLIQNDASLFDKDPISGLPFAAKLLLEPQHPFYEALEKTNRFTIANPNFYQQLNKTLQLMLKSNITEVVKAQIEKLIEANTRLCDSFAKAKSASISQIYIESERDIQNRINDVCGSEFQKRLGSDHDVMAINKAVRKQSLSIFAYSQKNDTSTEKAKVVSIVTKVHDTATQACKDIETNSTPAEMLLLYDQLKEAAIQDSIWEYRLGALALKHYILVDHITGYKKRNDRVAWAAASKELLQLHEELKIATLEHDKYKVEASKRRFTIPKSQPGTTPQAFFNSGASATAAAGTGVVASTTDFKSSVNRLLT